MKEGGRKSCDVLFLLIVNLVLLPNHRYHRCKMKVRRWNRSDSVGNMKAYRVTSSSLVPYPLVQARI